LFSRDGSTVDQQVAALLLAGRPGRPASPLRIATAESCTGGLLAARLTELPGSSEYFNGAVVVYANEAKAALAGVPAELIERHGAVSSEVAKTLADGARAALDADIGVGITGVAGPGGGTEQKPVGLVWVSVTLAACEDPSQVVEMTRSINLPGARADVRERATTIAMHLVRRALTDLDAPR
jgi:nicotinamide-nucleotide amidase